ncbi:MAG TPA: NUDIX domain-containing protein [Patescibacteria group bacterium]|nr:NUDIX domain-containing protein [Patescibacteria group bacterium]
MTREVVGCIIENDKKELLLQKKTLDYPYYGGGGWCLFGGRVESKDFEKEIERELEEEIGIKLKVKLIFNHELFFNNEKQIFHIFLAKLNDISKIHLGEGAGFAFFDKSELDNLNTNPDVKEILNIYYDNENERTN